jgi:hypothetical protein
VCGRRRLSGVSRVVLGAAAACASAAIMLPAAAAPTGGRIHGRVLDRTAPAHVVAGQIVRLTIVERGASSDQDATSGPSGAFEFTGLPVGGIRVFLLSTQYRGVRYVSDRIVLALQAAARAVDLIVYDSSSNRQAVRGTLALAVVDVAEGAVRVSVVQGFLNPTDRTVALTSEDPMVFPLPAEAEHVQTLAGWRDPRAGNGRIADTFPLPPGSTQVAYAYELKTSGSRLRLSWLLPYGASDLQVLVPETGVSFAAEGLSDQGTVTGPRGRYARWSGASVGPGTEVVMTFRGLPAGLDPWPAAVAAGLAVALFGGLALSLRRSPRGVA